MRKQMYTADAQYYNGQYVFTCGLRPRADFVLQS